MSYSYRPQRRQYSQAEKDAYYRRKSQANRSVGRRIPRAPRPVSRAPRRKTKYDYPGVGAKLGGAIGSMAGNLVAPGVGGYIGNALGNVVGGGAQALLKHVTGFGDYSVQKNAIMYNQDAVPEFSTNNERCTVVSHREFIQDIKSSVMFNNTTFRINPNIATSFPWLAALAENYEQYIIQGMVYEFKTTSATAIGSTNTTLGTVIMATQYNSLSPPFSSKQQMENYEFCQSTVPSQSIMHPIECDPLQTQCGGIFNMYNPDDASGDTRLYDIGRFNIATVGMQLDGAIVGELWCTYKICLLKPRLQAISNVADAYQQFTPSGISASFPVGVDPLAPFASNNGFTSQVIDGVNNNQFIINPGFSGSLLVMIVWELGSATTPTGTVTLPTPVATFGNIAAVTGSYFGNTNNIVGLIPAASVPHASMSASIFKSGGGYTDGGVPPTISFIGATVPGGCSFVDCTVQFIALPGEFLGQAVPDLS